MDDHMPRTLTSQPAARSRAARRRESSPPPPPSPMKHPVYRGIRSRGSKWVSEIREPGKMKRIWLGTFPTPEMAAAAYDVAALALKGRDAVPNFKDVADTFPVPPSTSWEDIQAAAIEAAHRFQKQPGIDGSASSQLISAPAGGPSTDMESAGASQLLEGGGPLPELPQGDQFVDEEVLFNMPNLLVDMAEGMLLTPPRLDSSSLENSPGNSEDERLWSYR
ncbi:Dehydration-responsive element-binding protein 1B [Nymphaea thermarum]|nr:Dehydration-responsive element-binding protein 1B [Nymphaea thermarum]